MISYVVIYLAVVFVAGIISFFIRKKKNSVNRYLWLGAWVAAVLSIWMIQLSWGTIAEKRHILSHWTKTKAVIVSSEVAGERSFYPDIRYRYEISGEFYEGDSDLDAPMFGGKRKKYDVAVKLKELYPEGSEIEIYYNPGNPGESYFHIVVTWDVYTKLSFGVLLLLASLVIINAGLLRRKKE